MEDLFSLACDVFCGNGRKSPDAVFKKFFSILKNSFDVRDTAFFLLNEGVICDSYPKNYTKLPFLRNSEFLGKLKKTKIVSKETGGGFETYIPVVYKNKLHGILYIVSSGPLSDPNALYFFALPFLTVTLCKSDKKPEGFLDRTEILYTVSRELSRTIDLEELLLSIVRLIKSKFELDNVAVLLKDADGKLRICAFSEGYNKKLVNTLKIDISAGMGITGTAAKERHTVISNDVKNDPRYINGNENTKSEMAIPLIYKGKLLGVLDLESNQTNRFDDYEKRILEAVASEVSVAIENALLYEKVKELAERDELTGLYNYRAFRRELDKEVSRAKRYGKVFSLAMFDIDFFKEYNDNNGHDMGNVALHRVGSIIRKACRKTDFPARFGGEEFVVILPETNKNGAFAFAERVRKIIGAAHFPGEERQPNKKLTVSGGVAEFPADGDDVEKIIKAVDVAAYSAKSNGRNRIKMFWEVIE